MPNNKQLDIIDLSLRGMSNLDLGHLVVSLAKAMRVHSGYQAPGSIPAPLLQPDALEQVGNNHIQISLVAERGDRDAKAARDALRPTTELHLIATVRWAVMRSVLENDASLIANLGLQLKTQTYKSGNVVVTAPQGVKVKHGKNGSVFISCGSVAKARTYEVGICQGDPSLESSWSIRGPYEHCRNIELTELEPGQVYYFRMRCFGAGGTSSWSAIVSIRIL